MATERNIGEYNQQVYLKDIVESVQEVDRRLNESIAEWFNFGLGLLRVGLGFEGNVPKSVSGKVLKGMKGMNVELAMRDGRLVAASLFGGRVVVSHSVLPIILKGDVESPRLILKAGKIADRIGKLVDKKLRVYKQRFLGSGEGSEGFYPEPRTNSDMVVSSYLIQTHKDPYEEVPNLGRWVGERKMGLRHINIGLIVSPYSESYLPSSLDPESGEAGNDLYDYLLDILGLRKTVEVHFNRLKKQAEEGIGPTYFGEPYIIVVADVTAPLPRTGIISPQSLLKPITPDFYATHPIDYDCRPSFRVYLGFERNYGQNEKPSPDDFLKLNFSETISPDIFCNAFAKIINDERTIAGRLAPQEE